jgi:hypothetical protein
MILLHRLTHSLIEILEKGHRQSLSRIERSTRRKLVVGPFLPSVVCCYLVTFLIFSNCFPIESEFADDDDEDDDDHANPQQAQAIPAPQIVAPALIAPVVPTPVVTAPDSDTNSVPAASRGASPESDSPGPASDPIAPSTEVEAGPSTETSRLPVRHRPRVPATSVVQDLGPRTRRVPTRPDAEISLAPSAPRAPTSEAELTPRRSKRSRSVKKEEDEDEEESPNKKRRGNCKFSSSPPPLSRLKLYVNSLFYPF